ncbi:MAG: DNA-binding protein [Chloroflexi bacterium]|nr:MAG: DNA-binding protein [Chloroflexota bacterium]
MLKYGGFFLLGENTMKYTKPALSFEEQAQRLLDRGLIAPDKKALTKQLSVVNYYRLSAYWYPFKRIDAKTGREYFASKTTFDMIWRRYTFDHHLRLLVMDAIERIEIAILRTHMVEQFTLNHGPLGYCHSANFSPKFNHPRLMREVDDAVGRSKEEFVQRFRGKYTKEKNLPLWIAAEVMTFGQLFTFFRFMHHAEKKELSRQFNVYSPVLESWLHTLLFSRNACAHHARLWNRQIPIPPKLPSERHSPAWHTPVQIDNQRIFAILTILNYLLSYITPNTNWQGRLENLLKDYKEIPLISMGFPQNWKEHPLWK